MCVGLTVILSGEPGLSGFPLDSSLHPYIPITPSHWTRELGPMRSKPNPVDQPERTALYGLTLPLSPPPQYLDQHWSSVCYNCGRVTNSVTKRVFVTLKPRLHQDTCCRIQQTVSTCCRQHASCIGDKIVASLSSVCCWIQRDTSRP